MAFLQLPAQYYKQHDADLTADIPGRGYDGWTTRMLDVPLARTALVSMHAWNPGLVDEIPKGVDSPYAGWFRFVEYLSRAVPITQTVFPPLLQAAREAQMTVIHVGSTEAYLDKYEGYRQARNLSGNAPGRPAGAVDDPLRQQWQEERLVQMRGKKNGEEIKAGQQFLDFPPQAMPISGEAIVADSHQLNAVCREKGIWHLVYIGFAINWCLLASPGGMIDMSRMGYVCSTIRQATTAVENKETCSDEWAKAVALWRVALMFGYVFDVDPFVTALQNVATS
jgi:nicotinamidase-related amidase